MSIRVALHHKTEYLYDRPVELHPHVVRLRPAPHCRTPILSYSLKVEPDQQFLNWQQDPYSNYLARLVFLRQAERLSFEVDLVAEMTVINPFDFFLEDYAERFPFQYREPEAHELTPYLKLLPSQKLDRYVEKWQGKECKTVDFLVEVNQALESLIGYVIRMEPGIQALDETLTKKSGSCRDTAWLMVQLLRRLGLAARFVSGYLIQLAPDVKALDGPGGPETDFTDLHAWAEVYLPGAGWVGLDATSGLLAGEGHLPLACSADPIGAAPITGSFAFSPRHEKDKVEEDFRFHMEVSRIHEDPRVTKPYSEEQWQEILMLGRQVDQRLQEQDVRLTMGGEPTFVSTDDMEAPEWTTDALGADKRAKAGELLKRLRDSFGPGGALFYGQGKLYPGEQLPRWALSCVWRQDGQAVWQNPALIADESKDYGCDATLAHQFVEKLAQRLQLSGDHIRPGYEDLFYYLWKEGQLPVNVTPEDSRLENSLERDRLRRLFEEGLGKVVGYALPIQYQNGWTTGPWYLRRQELYLIPGDSPMGYRLPLNSLPWVAEVDYPWVEPVDPFQELPPLPVRVRLQPGEEGEQPQPQTGQSASWLHRTALCVEPREGRLYVFLPPLGSAQSFLELVAAIEATAEEFDTPCLLEGYPAPPDPRLQRFDVTPDPGVIEVNIHPSSSWEELVEKTETLYEQARQTRLGTEKFMLDGRHSGTGGGNHILLGGHTPNDSPLLRRPDLLRSLVGYWCNHPSLSYLFSGLFVGPTSQAPRFDEARHEAVYEMEIAFDQLPVQPGPPWLVDRLFRHLLVDLTGNTHRAEFCIDKLYSPDGVSGRRGLLEMRSFEMPPHARMSLAQQLLLRALVARFWEQPYQEGLVHWGTELHDRFMLPHFVAEDFRDVLEETDRFGLALKKEWFEPHFEFRFPPIGSFVQRGLKTELRTAIEPWHVLGEEGGQSGQVRYVDSSLERLQVKVQGMVDSRHQLVCNGQVVPLHPTGTNGEFVAGLRYRAWQPPSCLHPTIGVHSPLVFDLLDRWNGRSIGGCQYHVSHPGGRSYDTFPVNAYEAESRRVNRFFTHGHTAGELKVDPPKVSRKLPFTLDLRRP